MHIPTKWQMKTSQIAEFISTYSFAVVIDSDFEATHIPLVYKADEGEYGTLYGHVGRANIHAKSLQHKQVLVVFNGPHSYISPTWYVTKPAVSTWNYAAVHAKGIVEYLGDEQTLACLDELISKYEPAILANTDLLPKDYQMQLLKGIIGFKIAITSLQAKEKLGQHKSAEDQLGVANGLESEPSLDAQALLKYMQAVHVGVGE